MNSQTFRNSIVYIVILAALGYFLWSSMFAAEHLKKEVEITNLNELISQINAEQVQNIEIEDNKLTVTYANQETIGIAHKEPVISLTHMLKLLGVDSEALTKVGINFVAPGFWSNWP
jgi:c-di-AMP phosphodiesterase-like protein